MKSYYYLILIILILLGLYLYYYYNRNDNMEEVDLSLFIYPSWEDPDMNIYELDFDMNRDIHSGTKRVFVEFLHITDPVMELESAKFKGQEVGVGIVQAGENHFGTKIQNGYSYDFAQKLRNTVAEPFVTLSGRGHWRRLQGRKNDPNLAHLMTKDQDYIDRTAEFIVDFVKNTCCFRGVNINIERLVLMSKEMVDKYIRFLEYLVKIAHEVGIQVIFTTITETAPYEYVPNNPNGIPIHFSDPDVEGYIPRHMEEGYFYHNKIYHIPFDYINYMTIDQFWASGDKTLGSYDFPSMKKYLDISKEHDPYFKKRTIVQFSNYTVWGYNQGFFDNNGIIISDEDRIKFVNKGDPPALGWQFQIVTWPKLLKLLKGEDDWLWRAWTGKNDDIRWDETAGYSLEQGFRLENGEKVIVLGDGFINRREYDVKDGEHGPIEETIVIVSDQYSMDKKAKWVYDNYGINKFSIWHGGRDMPWFSKKTIEYLNNGNGIPIFDIDNPCNI